MGRPGDSIRAAIILRKTYIKLSYRSNETSSWLDLGSNRSRPQPSHLNKAAASRPGSPSLAFPVFASSPNQLIHVYASTATDGRPNYQHQTAPRPQPRAQSTLHRRARPVGTRTLHGELLNPNLFPSSARELRFLGY